MSDNLQDILQAQYKIYRERQASHLHLKNAVSGVTLSTNWLKLDLTTVNMTIKTLGGFTFDDTNNRIYWDANGVLGASLPSTFVGNAGIQITSTIVSPIVLTLGLFIDEGLILETPLTFAKKETIQGYGANGILLDGEDVDLLQSGSYYDFRIKASAGTPIITLNYFNTTIQRD